MPEKDTLNVAKKVSGELSVWCVMSSISLGVSASIISDAIRAIPAYLQTYQVLVNVFLVSFGAVWFLLSATLLYNIWNIEKKHGYFLLLRLKKHMLNTNEIVDFVKDAISLYRGYRWYIIFVGLLALITGTVMITFSIHGYIVGTMKINGFIFRFFVGLLIFSYATLSLYLERVFMAKKLTKVKSFEDRLSKLLE